MSLVLKLYSSGLDSLSSPLPIIITEKPYYEVTIRDLQDHIERVLSDAPYIQFKR